MREKMFHRSLMFAAALALIVCSVRAEDGPEARRANDVTEKITKSFKVRPGGTLILDLDRGDIEVLSARGNEVRIEIELVMDVHDRSDAKRLMENYQVDFDQRDDEVYVSSRYEKSHGILGKWRDGDRFRIHLTALVPERYSVDFSSGAGNIYIENLTGEVEGHTGAGNIQIGDINGPVRVKSGAGNIQVDRAVGFVEVNTGAGNVTLDDVEGEIDAQAGAGNIDATITRQPSGDSRLTTGAGNVTAFLSDRVGVEVEATSGMGSANTDFPLKVEGKWMTKSIQGSINGGGPGLFLRAGMGNVSLRRL